MNQNSESIVMGRILSKHTDIQKEQKSVTSLQEKSPTPLKSICLFRSYFEVKTSFVVRHPKCSHKIITKCSHADAIGNKQIFFMPAKKKV